MISSLLFPSPFEPDFRPMIILTVFMIFSIAYLIRKNRNNINNYINDEWESF